MPNYTINPLVFGSKTKRIVVTTTTTSEREGFKRIANQLLKAAVRKRTPRETPIERLVLLTSGAAEIVERHREALLTVAGLSSIEILEERAGGGKNIAHVVPLPDPKPETAPA